MFSFQQWIKKHINIQKLKFEETEKASEIDICGWQRCGNYQVTISIKCNQQNVENSIRKIEIKISNCEEVGVPIWG